LSGVEDAGQSGEGDVGDGDGDGGLSLALFQSICSSNAANRRTRLAGKRLNHGGTGYFSDAVNLCQAAAGVLSVIPSRSFVSRIVITPPSLAVSRQSPPLSFE
jgi:hypothetical protein